MIEVSSTDNEDIGTIVGAIDEERDDDLVIIESLSKENNGYN